MKKLDIMTLIGIIGGTILLSVAIISAGGFTGAKAFLSISSALTVFGGLAAALLINFSKAELKEAWLAMKGVFSEEEVYDVNGVVEEFVELSTMARREGLLSLDRKLEELNDPFIKKGILLTVDGLEADVIKEILMAEVIAIEERKKVGRIVLDKAGELAPAWGMIGTLIGLILMLRNLEDPKTIGPSMALALITTFYGAVLANFIFIPMSGKIMNRTENEMFIKQIMIEGILGVQSGQNPKLLREKLEAFIDKSKQPKQQENAEATDVEVEYNV